ncbi:MAG: rubrerythrin [Candidatus Raymondbacteria bacterium RifOxyA12_full_50_37]|uniref:Rubrerythrin n=1 Tax=Candidatus Raymondbacteria bacterium RIFOXYD12_FULL_49_13 TaxID=1817890 RepID=A0A1F7FK79_UNCRA|nr:MAG: rubrerythrin [Candidatus Raymondbacteria bacterium RifOxyA12_full_50_37]OGJ94542.1 MAG: rubrerythrin [Candidatus Raymondbacteria bacterium RIFOXYA2_FULL_49_16]OGJ98530.1 MAG: rubrerythrin [Candidatus Raymondbacteria bacterium RifOxyC12_full_50_8]OGK01691.1 MAG: rubrerythrin [Candidatus Raymondbacteria bacterium RifOxyB12_full_50_8]OGK07018.1 MAG: rubrerythrin [Candidatus Raymondbacteria bacterium RIFOXYD12_FULL_49_13]OGP45491.1 MAG: rubrerythrin [Candidatus Raymondbacteria bacterium RI
MAQMKGSKTEKNLLKSFAGESQARNRYTYFASIAKKEGYIQISNIFSETADNEKEHAKRMFKFLEGGVVEITASYPAGKLGTTAENLAASAAGENEEWTELYPSFAKTAREEGFEDVAKMYEAISIAEKQHEKRYNDLLANIKASTVLKKASAITWRCSNCGYIHKGAEAPKTCPACAHPQVYYEVLAENW